jgi:hypothetical protein
LKTLMPILESLTAIAGDKPEVKYYEGLEGLEAMRNVLFESKEKHLDGICDLDKLRNVIPEEQRILYNLRMRKAGFSARQIIITKEKKFKMPELTPAKASFKTLHTSNFNSCAEVAIFGNHVSLIVYVEKPFGILIKNKDIASLVKLLFERTWLSL